MFSITVLKESLAEVMKFITPIVIGDIKKVNADCLKITVSSAGSARFFMYNPTESIEVECICSTVSQVGDIAPLIKFDRIKKIVATIPDGEYISIKAVSAQSIEITYGTKKPTTLNATGMNTYPTEPKIFSEDRKQGASVYVNFLENASNKASKIITSSSGSQVSMIQDYIKIKAGNPDITAEGIDSNTKRTFFMKRNDSLEVVPKEFLLKADRMAKVVKMFAQYNSVYIYDNTGMTMVACDSSSLRPSNNQWVNDIVDVKYASLNSAAQFPDIGKFYDKKYEPKEFISISKQETLDAIARVEAILDTGNALPQSLEINTHGSEFVISYTSMYGDVKEDILTQGSINKALRMAFKPNVFKEIINNISSEYIEIGLMANTQNNFLIRGSHVQNNKFASDDSYTLITLALANTP